MLKQACGQHLFRSQSVPPGALRFTFNPYLASDRRSQCLLCELHIQRF
jgi:hypothetical protein